MGFSKKNVLSVIHVPLRFIHQHENTETGAVFSEDHDVEHIFKMPSAHQRSRYQRENVKVKGKKMIYSGPEASWNLFQACIRRVEGYDDLPSDAQTRASIVEYFNDDIIRHHAEEAADELIRLLESEDMQLEKKSGPSSGA